jgi:hypothetical protein
VFGSEYIIKPFKGKRRMVNVDTGRSKRGLRYTSKSSTRKSQKRVSPKSVSPKSVSPKSVP